MTKTSHIKYSTVHAHSNDRTSPSFLFAGIDSAYMEKLHVLKSWRFLLTFIIILSARKTVGQLSVGFYSKTCPNVEGIVKQVVTQKQQQSIITGPSTLRLLFHDCFVGGCDGSILISSTPGNKAERDAVPNLSLAGDAFDTIVRAKKAVEAQCPGVVSCADILAIAARDAVVLMNGPSWAVKKGRRDGRVSRAANVLANLPGANMNWNQLNSSFTSKGLNLMDLVVLSGAHTVGHAHCDQFRNRLYSFRPAQATDPSLNPSLAKQLEAACPRQGGDVNIVEQFDGTPFSFDNTYYNDLAQGRGLLFSDEVLFSDARTRWMVRKLAKRPGLFFQSFAASMDKMGSIGVLTGSNGEIRKDCTRFN